MTKGIDLFVTYKGVKFGVSLFVDTKRSKYYKNNWNLGETTSNLMMIY